MCKSVIYSCTFVLFFCVTALSATEYTFIIRAYCTDIEYKLYDEPVTWQQAKERCADAGSELLVPEDVAEAEAVWEALSRLGHDKGLIWTGINDQNNSGVYQNLHGQRFSALPLDWGTHLPDYGNVTERCLQQFTHALYVGDCLDVATFVCKRRDELVMLCNETFTLKTDSDDILMVVHHNYKYVSWYEARERCEDASAQLWAPREETEAVAVREEVKRVSNYSIWTSITDLSESGVYRTLDGRLASELHNKWRGGHPVSGREMQCAALGPDSLLHLASCDTLLPFVCNFSEAGESENLNITTPTPPDTK